MRNVIFKYDFERHEMRAEHWMPVGAKIVHVAKQGERACIWAEVDPNAENELRKFVIVGTGQTYPDNFVHVGTFFSDPTGTLVWHIMEDA